MLWLTRTYAPTIRICLTRCDAQYSSRRLYSATTSSSDEARDAASSLSSGYSGTHPRRHGNNSLPLSPLLSPEYEAATRRHKQPKPEQDEDTLTDFQKELALNPYARALATDIRQCSLTAARLPRHFLLPFSSRISRPPHPPQPNLQANQKPWPNKPLAKLHPVSYQHGGPETLTTNAYLVNRIDVLEQADRRGHWKILVTERMEQKFAPVAQKNHRSLLAKDWWMWTKGEMMGWVRAELEREVVGALRKVVDYEGGALVKSGALSAADGEKGVACILVLRDGEHERAHPPLSLGTFYDLPYLLTTSESGISDLLSDHPKFGQLINIIRHDLTTRLQLKLDRLVGHLESNKLIDDLKKKARRRDEFRSQRFEERARELADWDQEARAVEEPGEDVER